MSDVKLELSIEDADLIAEALASHLKSFGQPEYRAAIKELRDRVRHAADVADAKAHEGDDDAA